MEPSKDLIEGNPYDDARKRPVETALVVVSPTSYENRHLELIQPISRAMLQHEIHELMVTDGSEAAEKEYIDNVGVLGFVEIQNGGVIAVDDEVTINDESFGQVIGFDATHVPNHYNIVIQAESVASGISCELELGSDVRFL